MIETGRTEADRLLGIYLRDHFAGSTGGLELLRRCRRANHDEPLAAMLADIEGEIVEERTTLGSIMARSGVRPSAIKSAIGSIAVVLGRLKSNGRFARYSPSSRVVELEGLAAAVTTKRNLWRSLAVVADGTIVADAEVERLIEQATAQFDRLVAAHREAAERAFGGANERRSGREPRPVDTS